MLCYMFLKGEIIRNLSESLELQLERKHCELNASHMRHADDNMTCSFHARTTISQDQPVTRHTVP